MGKENWLCHLEASAKVKKMSIEKIKTRFSVIQDGKWVSDVEVKDIDRFPPVVENAKDLGVQHPDLTIHQTGSKYIAPKSRGAEYPSFEISDSNRSGEVDVVKEAPLPLVEVVQREVTAELL